MTIAVTERVNGADPTEELTRLADEVGVFVSSDLTERQQVLIDQTGGLEVIDAVLQENTGQFEVVEPLHEAAAPKPSLFRRALAVLVRVRDALSTSVAWLAEPVVRSYRRRVYRSRHRVEVRWFGVQLSTAQRVTRARRRVEARPPQEPVLRSQPYDYHEWCSHMASIIESLRHHEELRRHVPEHGRRFVCS